MRHQFSIVLLGDTVEASKWIPFAKARSLTLHDNGMIFTIPFTGITVRVHKTRQFVNIYIEAVKYRYYLETGVNYWTYPGEGNSTKYLPGDWKILDGAPYSGVRQGWYDDGDTVYLDHNESLAIGEGYEPTDPEEKATWLATKAPFVQQKKILTGLFQPSMFSGMLRLYMQSQYGADNETAFQFYVDIFGTAITLHIIKGGETEQIGFWAHRSSGLVRVGVEDDLDYRFVTIANSGSAGAYVVRECPIAFNAGTDKLQADYRATTDIEEKLKILAYLFGHSRIDINSFRDVDTFELDNKGSDMVYGWHFNQAANKASICLTEDYVDGSNNIHYDSSLVTIEFGSETLIDEEGDTQINVTLTGVTEGSKTRWVSISSVQLWVPDFATGTCSRWNAGWTDFGTYGGRYAYSGAQVYCWYDEADTLQEIVLGYSTSGVPDGTSEIIQSGNIEPRPPGTAMSHFRKGWVLQTEPRWAQQITWYSTTTATVDVGGISKTLTSGSTTIDYFSSPGGSGSTAKPPPNNFVSDSFASIGRPLGYDDSPDIQTWKQHYLDEHDPDLQPVSSLHYWGSASVTTVTGYANATDELCNVYIPAGDAEAVYCAEMTYVKEDNLVVWDTTGTLPFRQFASCGLDEYTQDIETWADGQPYIADGVTVGGTPVPITSNIQMTLVSKSQTIEGVHTGSYFNLPGDVDDPPSKTYYETYNVDAYRGSDVPSGSPEAQGIWTGWI